MYLSRSTKTRRLLVLAFSLLVAGSLAASEEVAATGAVADATFIPCQQQVKTFVPPVGTNFPFGVTSGPGGTWFAHGATIDRIRDGAVQEYPVPDPSTANIGWLVGSAGRTWVWFADRGNGRIGRIDAQGTITEYQIPPGSAGTALPQGIVLGPGPYVWFTDQANNRIGVLNLNGATFDFVDVPTAASTPLGLTRGVDGDLYFVERAAAKIGRLDPGTDLFTEWTLGAGSFPQRIITGSNGDIYFTELSANKLGRIDEFGHLHEYALAGGPVGLVESTGHLFVVLYSSGELAEVSLTGRLVKSWELPDAAGVLQVAPSRGAIWVTDGFADHVYRVSAYCPG